MPACGQRTCLSLSIADDTAGDKIRIIEHSPKGVQEGIAKLSPFVN